MVPMPCEEHDRLAAGTQFLTHTVGRVLGSMGVGPTEVDTRGYQSLLSLVTNTANDSFDLYYGLFMYNPVREREGGKWGAGRRFFLGAVFGGGQGPATALAPCPTPSLPTHRTRSKNWNAWSAPWPTCGPNCCGGCTARCGPRRLPRRPPPPPWRRRRPRPRPRRPTGRRRPRRGGEGGESCARGLRAGRLATPGAARNHPPLSLASLSQHRAAADRVGQGVPDIWRRGRRGPPAAAGPARPGRPPAQGQNRGQRARHVVIVRRARAGGRRGKWGGEGGRRRRVRRRRGRRAAGRRRRRRRRARGGQVGEIAGERGGSGAASGAEGGARGGRAFYWRARRGCRRPSPPLPSLPTRAQNRPSRRARGASLRARGRPGGRGGGLRRGRRRRPQAAARRPRPWRRERGRRRRERGAV